MKKKERRYFQFFREWYEPLRMIDSYELKGRLLEAVVDYCLHGKEPTAEDVKSFGAVGAMYWGTIYSSLHNSRQNYLNGCNGGAPKGSRNAAKFTPPTLDDVEAYFEDNGFSSDASLFFDYNEAMGWASAKKHFKDWKTAADRWEEKEGEYDE